MAETPKRMPGRPRKSPLEKPEQFSIRLPLQRKLELEVLARSRNESLSQAVVRAIEVASKVIEVQSEEKSVQEVVHIGMAASIGYFRDKNGYPYTFDAVQTLIIKNPNAYRVLVIPESLRLPEEKMFASLLDTIASSADNDDAIIGMAKHGELDKLLRACAAANIYGVTPESLLKDDESITREKIKAWLSHVFKTRPE